MLYATRLIARLLLLSMISSWIPSAPIGGPLSDPPVPPIPTAWPIDTSNIPPAPATPQPPAGGALSDPSAPLAPVTLSPAVDPQLPSLAMDVVVAADTVAVGETTTFTITVRNSAPAPARHLLLSVAGPSGAVVRAGGTSRADTAPTWQWTTAELLGTSTAVFTGLLQLTQRPTGDVVLLHAEATADGVTVPAHASGGAWVLVDADTDARTATFVPGAGTELRSREGRVTVQLPQNAFASRLGLRYRSLAAAAADLRAAHQPLPPTLANGHRVGASFVLDATDARGAAIHQFTQPLTITVRYTAEQLQLLDIPEGDLKILWFDATAGRWMPIPTQVDSDARTLSAVVDHFSVFTIGDGLSPSTAFVPTLQGFQVSSFTGAASYTYPIEVPAGPGGLTPDVTLSYSSATSDGTNGERTKWQASWIGKGWSFDPGSVSLNKSTVGDSWNNFTLSFAGRSFDLVRGQPLAGYATNDPFLDHWNWYAVDEEFVRFRVDWAGDVTVGTGPTATYRTYIWHAWTKDGIRYDFGLNSNALWWTNDLQNREVYKWLLVKVTDTHGNKIVYDYQIDAVQKSLNGVVAPYHPTYFVKAISWAYDGSLATDPFGTVYRTGSPHYQIVFNDQTVVSRQSGTTAGVDPQWDYPASNVNTYWQDAAPHEVYRLDTIKVLSKPASTFQLVRQYNFGHASSATSVQTDDYTGNKTLTLTGIERLDSNGAAINVTGAPSPRPFLTSFTYYTDPGPATDTRPAGFNRLATINNGQGGKLTFTYEHAFVKNSTDLHDAPPTNEWALYRNFHRVASVLVQDLSGTGRGALTTYTYEYPGVNDYNLSAAVVYARYPSTGNGDSRQWLAHPEKHEFRGHRKVIARQYSWTASGTTPLQETRQWFYQGDACPVAPPVSGALNENDSCFQSMVSAESWKGKAYQTEVAAIGATQPLQRTVQSFARTELPFYGDASSAGYSNHYKRVGLWRAFIATVQQDEIAFEGGTTSVTKTTKYTYQPTYYDAVLAQTVTYQVGAGQYGNLTREEVYDRGTLIRITEHNYSTLDTAGSYIVNREWQSPLRDAQRRLLALTNTFYDGNNTNANVLGTVGDVTRVLRLFNLPLQTASVGTFSGQDTTTTYDAYGNRLTESTFQSAGTRTLTSGGALSFSTTGSGSAARTTTTTYDSIYHVFPVSSVNALGHTETATYDYRMGTLTSVTDPNSNTTSAGYDSFGRLVTIVKPGDSASYPTLVATYDDTARPFRYQVAQREQAGTTNLRYTQLFYDGIGQQIQTKQEGPAAWQNIVVDTRYDGLGQVVEQSQARYSNENATTFWQYTAPGTTLFNHTTTSYDALSRPLDVTEPDGTVTQTRYWIGSRGLATGVYDANKHLTAYESDALGRRSWVYEYHGTGTGADPYVADTTTTSVYSPLDLLMSVTDQLGNVTSMGYDSLGRKTSMNDPDMGAWSYAYDANGNLVSQLDAKGQTISFTYDAVNRLTQKTMPDGWISAYAYDETNPAGANINGIGQRTTMMTWLNGVAQTYVRWEYDARGRTTLVGQAVSAGVTTDLVYSYDSADRVGTTTYYEASETVSTSYDAAGRPYSMCGTTCYVQSATYSALGQPQQRALITGGLTTSWVYDSPMQRLHDLEVGSVATPASVGHRGYAYDPVGNIQTITDYIWGQYQNFTYDARDRLTHAWTTGSAGAPGMAYDISTTYNVLGNLMSKSDLGTYVYGPTNSGPHQVRTIGSINLSYDANGNMAVGGAWNYSWNADNTLASMTNPTSGASESYSYDADGERVVRTAGGVTTVSFQGVWEQTTTGVRTLYYSFNGDTVALRTSAGVQYLQGDHLGSMTWAFNASGGQVGGEEYGPWGQVRAVSGSLTSAPLNYTGQRLDATGLLYYHARYYNPVLARFISADSIIPGQSDTAGTANPQNLNRYTYVNNNPINRTDPSGHDWEHFAQFALGVAQGALATINSVVQTSTPYGAADAGVNLGMAIGRDPAGFVQGVKDQVNTVIRGGANLVNDPAGAAATLYEHSGELGQVMGQALATAALAKALPDSGACSFRADTPVATEDGETAIGDLRVGDHVLAYNQTTGDTGSYTVTKVLVHTDPVVLYLTIHGERIETTPDHPFYTHERGWSEAGALRIGEHIRRISGGYGTVQGRQIVSHAQVMYNLTVAVAHTFFVGSGQWLVHNICGQGKVDRIYRAVTPGEAASLKKTGMFSTPNTTGAPEGKYFAETLEHADAWGRMQYGPGKYSVVAAKVPKDVPYHVFEKLDGIGPARFYHNDSLPDIRYRGPVNKP